MEKKSVVMELRRLNHLIRRYFENSPVKKQVDKITGTNGWIIGYIAEHPDKEIYQKDLEEQFSITRSTASKVLSLMEKKGLIQRQNVAHDARLRKIVLTQKALDISEMMANEGKQFEETLIKGFTDEEFDNLFYYIQKMKDNIKNF